MEKIFDFTGVLKVKNHEEKHKNKPTQFVSVAGGVKKRLENNLKHRKSSRLTFFDSIRNLSRCSSPALVSEAQQKMEHRRQQLEKWKEEKAKKKKEAASQKQKPFIAGVPHAPLKFVPPPPVPVKPSTSGRVTRSQTARNSKQEKEKQTLSQSFAPKNASFKPPQFKKAPYVNLVALKPIKSKAMSLTFEPVLPQNTRLEHTISEVNQARVWAQNSRQEHTISVVKQARSRAQNSRQEHTISEVKQTRSRAQNSRQEHTISEVKHTRSRAQNKPVDAKINKKSNEVKTKGKTTKPLTKTNSKTLQSSSSSDVTKSPITRTRKSFPIPQSPTFQSSTETDSSSQSPITSNTRKSPRKSTPRKLLELKQFTPKNPVPKSESPSEERLRSSKSPLDVLLTPEQMINVAKKISPCVTMSRGKEKAIKEMKQKLKEGLLDEDASDIENIDHFRRQLASEIKRMTEMCETWDRIVEQTVLSDSIHECVLSAVGQARLLMSQKLQQFAMLLERCARPEPAHALVTPADLHGFWDMVFMQVVNVDMRFKKLEELRARGWVEETVAVVQKKVKKAAPAHKKPVAASSRLKDMIAAARKAKKEQEPAPVEKTFEAGFFCVKSPVRSPAPHRGTPLGKPTLLKAVLSNEAKKSASKNSASFAMLRASVLGKNVECEGVEPLPQTPLPDKNATPGRSILKQNTDGKKPKKSIKVVLFDQSDNESDDQPIGDQLAQPIVKEIKELNADSGLSSMDLEKEKENCRRKSRRLTRQEATEEYTTASTRSRRKNRISHETKTPERRSTRKSKVLEEVETNVIEKQTPK